jgi:hypothetical protein
MAQVVPFPRTLVFTRAFEQLPLFSERANNGDLFCAGLIDGKIEVSVAPSGDWWVSDLHIVVKNACRAETATKTVRLDPDECESLYWHALDVLTDKFATTISAWIDEAITEADLRGRAA